jgi:hypothetical protein
MLPEDVKLSLVGLKTRMEATGAYNSPVHAIRTASSGEASDDSEVDEEFIF